MGTVTVTAMLSYAAVSICGLVHAKGLAFSQHYRKGAIVTAAQTLHIIIFKNH